MKSKFDKVFKMIYEDITDDFNDVGISDDVLDTTDVDKIDDAIENIKSLLANESLFNKNERILKRILKYLNILKLSKEKNFENYDNIVSLLSSINLSHEYAEEVAEEMERMFEPEVCRRFASFLSGKRLSVLDWCRQKVSSLSELFSAANLDSSPEFIDYLLNKRFFTQPAMGRAEFLFTIIFQDGKFLVKKKKKDEDENAANGDILIGDKMMEVKADDARIGGQSGFGSGTAVADFFKEYFIGKFNAECESTPNINFNFNLERLLNHTNAFLQLCDLHLERDSNGLTEARKILLLGLQKLYTNNNAFIDAVKFSNFTEYLKISSDGKKYYFDIEEIDDFYKAFAAFALKYYVNIENFKYLTVLNGDKFIILTNDSLKNAKAIKDAIKLKTMPSFGVKAGVQGIRTCISLA